MEILSTSAQKTEELAKTVAKRIEPGMVLALYGDLGSGKTTFVRFLVKALGFDSRVQSPTFVLHRCYTKSEGVIKTIHHIDLYRLALEEEVLDFGLEELLQDKSSLVLIEWPELATDLLPDNAIRLRFTTVDENTRNIIVEGLD